MITARRLRELLDYDPETGVFTRKVARRGHRIGSVAGTLDRSGYRTITVDRAHYCAHRLAWLHVNGRWPPGMISHKNDLRDDNRIANLREATSPQSARGKSRPRTNTSGFKGATWLPRKRKWQSEITVNGRSIWLGLFHTAEEAHAAYCAAAIEHHGKFARFS